MSARRTEILTKSLRYWMAEARRLRGYARRRAWANAIDLAGRTPGWVQLKTTGRNRLAGWIARDERGFAACGLARVTYVGPRGAMRGRVQYLTRGEGAETSLGGGPR